MCGMGCPTAAEHVPAAAADCPRCDDVEEVFRAWEDLRALGRFRACPRSRHVPNGDRCNNASSRTGRQIEAEKQAVAYSGHARAPS